MTEKKDKFLEAVMKLIKFTQEGKIKWRAGNLIRDDIKVESVFITEYKNKLLRLYKYVYEMQDPGPYVVTITQGIKYPYWKTAVTLEFIDSNGLSLWEFPTSYAIFDLLHTVQYQVAEVDDFLNSITSEE